MRTFIFLLMLASPALCFAQGGLGIGIKGGINFANVSNASDINNSSSSGYHFGVFLAPHSKGIISSRHEFIYSREGYSFKSATNTGNVNLDYLIIPQFICINITKYVQLQFGIQMALLLNAKADSTNTTTNETGQYPSTFGYYNKIDYGFGAGVELHPVSGLLIGARYNLSLAKLYSSAQMGQMPSFASVDAKNNMIQIFAGWIFGKHDKSSKKKKDSTKN